MELESVKECSRLRSKLKAVEQEVKTQWLAGCRALLLCHIPCVPRDNRNPCQVAFQNCPVTRQAGLRKTIRETMLTWRTKMKHVQPFFWLLLTRPLDAVGGCLPRNGQCWEETRPAGVLSLLDRGSADPATSSQSENSTSVHVSSHISCPGKYTVEKGHTSVIQALQLCIFSSK